MIYFFKLHEEMEVLLGKNEFLSHTKSSLELKSKGKNRQRKATKK